MCIRDTAITIVTAAKENPILTPEMKTAISKEEKAWEQLKQYKIQEEVRRIEELEKNSKDDSGNSGCLCLLLLHVLLGRYSLIYQVKCGSPFNALQNFNI